MNLNESVEKAVDQGKRKPILLLDFDGVLHSYISGWQGPDVIPDPPVEGAIKFLWEAIEVFDVQIFSSRSNYPGGIEAMRTWVAAWDNAYQTERAQLGQPTPRTCLILCVEFPTEKPPALVALDDRAITFTGTWPALEELRSFRPWNKKGDTE